MSAKHSQGKWTLRLNRSAGGGYEHAISTTAGTICLMPGWKMHPELEAEQVSNAHLLAAAPDLLQCLKWMVAMHEAKQGLSSGPEYCASLNAIKKALGETA